MASITSAAVKVTNQQQTAAIGLSRPVREQPWACQKANGTSNPVGGSGVPVIATPTRGAPSAIASFGVTTTTGRSFSLPWRATRMRTI